MNSGEAADRIEDNSPAYRRIKVACIRYPCRTPHETHRSGRGESLLLNNILMFTIRSGCAAPTTKLQSNDSQAL